MPIYLCKPGWAVTEPWRHGVQVYAYPFPIDESVGDSNSIEEDKTTNTTPSTKLGLRNRNASTALTAEVNVDTNETPQQQQQRMLTGSTIEGDSTETTGTSHRRTWPLVEGLAIRRVRHAEVVLVDEVSVHFNRFWLRLRWPGPRGGVAGFIALGSVMLQQTQEAAAVFAEKKGDIVGIDGEMFLKTDTKEISDGGNSRRTSSHREIDGDDVNLGEPAAKTNLADQLPEDDAEEDDASVDPPPTAPQDDGDDDQMQESEKLAMLDQLQSLPPKCDSTGLYFPSSSAMELLAHYDDGLAPQTNALSIDGSDSDIAIDSGGEPVFCRICREGLHDVNYDTHDINNFPSSSADGAQQQHLQARRTQMEEAMNTGRVQRPVAQDLQQQQNNGQPEEEIAREGNQDRGLTANERDEPDEGVTDNRDAFQSENTTGQSSNPKIILHHPYAENPLVAPCECSGSMAFVHYLCVEQWRCRSHHPIARNGLNCETCGKPYSLPPPPSRPTSQGHGGGGDEDWLEAMPPHVLAALRRPHPWWQMGAAIVRRRWLRPIAPVIMSPIVALYCRARRTLKKRGVSRRRWACSLCRRRARWKCVRCLRSYYCSRQCQNVSWHIVHKHVCYKPARFWWSVAVYGVGTVVLFPGILKYPAVYDLGSSLLFISFMVMGIIGGFFATVMKRGMGIDIRGRSLELFVVLMTIWLASVSWGLVWGYFGDVSQCWGVFSGTWWTNDESESLWTNGESESSTYPENMGIILRVLYSFLLRPGKVLIRMLDKFLMKSSTNVTRWVCTSEDDVGLKLVTDEPTCLRMTRIANPQFFFPEFGGEKCASDLNTVGSIWMFAGFTLLAGTVFKRRDRDRRAAGRQRPHQD